MNYDYFLWKLGVVKEEQVLEDLRNNTFQRILEYAVCLPEDSAPGTTRQDRRIFYLLVEWLQVDHLIRYRVMTLEYGKHDALIDWQGLQQYAEMYIVPNNRNQSLFEWSYDSGYHQKQDVQMFGIQFVQHLQKHMLNYLIAYSQDQEEGMA